MLAQLVEEYAIAQEFGWTLPEIRAMKGHPDPTFISAEEWRLWCEILNAVGAEQRRKLK